MSPISAPSYSSTDQPPRRWPRAGCARTHAGRTAQPGSSGDRNYGALRGCARLRDRRGGRALRFRRGLHTSPSTGVSVCHGQHAGLIGLHRRVTGPASSSDRVTNQCLRFRYNRKQRSTSDASDSITCKGRPHCHRQKSALAPRATHSRWFPAVVRPSSRVQGGSFR
jgi:hypothetical protein